MYEEHRSHRPKNCGELRGRLNAHDVPLADQGCSRPVRKSSARQAEATRGAQRRVELIADKIRDYEQFEPINIELHPIDVGTGETSCFLIPDCGSSEREKEIREGPSRGASSAIDRLRRLSSESSDGWIQRSDWVKDVGGSSNTFNNHLGELRAAGLVEEEKRGRFKFYRPKEVQ